MLLLQPAHEPGRRRSWTASREILEKSARRRSPARIRPGLTCSHCCKHASHEPANSPVRLSRSRTCSSCSFIHSVHNPFGASPRRQTAIEQAASFPSHLLSLLLGAWQRAPVPPCHSLDKRRGAQACLTMSSSCWQCCSQESPGPLQSQLASSRTDAFIHGPA